MLQSKWHTLPNPFLRQKSAKPLLSSGTETISGYVSGRLPEILEIISGRQSAFILWGAPFIGKTVLIKYLALTPQQWSWRDELAPLRQQLEQAGIYPYDIHFVSVDLTPLENSTMDKLLETFETQCVRALQEVYRPDREAFPPELQNASLREILRDINARQPSTRYFVMLDSIERLGRLTSQALSPEDEKKTHRDRGLMVLEQGNIIHELVELNEEFPNFGVLLSIENIPGPSIDHQFCRISINLSNDLSRFETIILKTLTWENAEQFLQQSPESGGSEWAYMFHEQHGDAIFTKDEQAWLLEQAGTHLYLLQHCCFHAFELKQKKADSQNSWPTLDDNARQQLIEKITQRLGTFFLSVWNRLDSALKESSQETQKAFYDFLLAPEAAPNKNIDTKWWRSLDRAELRYILESEGVVSFDRFDESEKVRYPGAILLQYLIQKAQSTRHEQRTKTLSTPELSPLSSRGFWLKIQSPESTYERISLSEIEYRVFKALLDDPQHERTEEELMQAAWGTKIEKSPFSQRIHHLRRKLQRPFPKADIIENAYGGRYTLNHHEWFRLE